MHMEYYYKKFKFVTVIRRFLLPDGRAQCLHATLIAIVSQFISYVSIISPQAARNQDLYSESLI